MIRSPESFRIMGVFNALKKSPERVRGRLGFPLPPGFLFTFRALNLQSGGADAGEEGVHLLRQFPDRLLQIALPR